jgi:hypothetical protein
MQSFCISLLSLDLLYLCSAMSLHVLVLPSFSLLSSSPLCRQITACLPTS